VSPEYDDLYDSFAHARAERGRLPTLQPEEARAYVRKVRDEVLALLPELSFDNGNPLLDRGFVVGMVVQHELQHAETMAQTLALAGLSNPEPPEVNARGDVLVPGGSFVLGADDPWAYDNERPAHLVELPPFRIDRGLVTNAEYAAFAGDCRDPVAPPHAPVQHVSFHEAEAYARWAGARLPTEPEWERAVPHLSYVGQVWEWTSSSFEPYPGFHAFPYDGYSAVFFGTGRYRVLRGGSWATHGKVGRHTFRNWDLPIRRQIFAGLRLAHDV